MLYTRMQKFKENRKAYASSLLLSICFLLSFLGNLFFNDRPLLIKVGDYIMSPLFNTDSAEINPSLENNISWAIWSPVHFSPYTVDLNLDKALPSSPDSQHWLGTDDRGRDVFARLFFGFRISLSFALLLALLSACLGTLIGSLQAYYGSWFDLLIQKFSELLSSFPDIFILTLLTSLFHSSYSLLLLFMAFSGWIPFAEYMRAEMLRIRQLDYMQSAKGLGASDLRLIFIHAVPNALNPLLSYLPQKISSVIIVLAALDFLGMGLPSPTPSLGELIYQGKNHLHCWWILLSSIGTLTVIVVCLSFISEGIRDAMDPKHY